eukprot:CAMPEP_0198308738 /NCGR_PEP_ID=MMETSP1450-20131203/1319_1 /TAXON_ID=753684 ORGANISM="Madagascaria erythrocladiodes, Strain CCMP3234" /NCGR_SAMPLE_ID=MMETSP1450 /ASSEMBLY_ACC=CAM_ASM_001115 /LENGTH=267 /DNA_ID=CAMNT_0044011441 /DNA_START=51 /DNA_END=850 /DNA_ORIENTATION=+
MSKRARENDTSGAASTAASTWPELLRTTTVQQLIDELRPSAERFQLVMLPHTASVRDALDALADKNVLSAPVVSASGEFLGLVDVLDLAAFLLATWRKHSRSYDERAFPAGAFFARPVTDALNYSGVDHTMGIPLTASLQELLDMMNHEYFNHRLHRVGVLDAAGTVRTLVSQSDLLRFAKRHEAALGGAASVTMHAAGLVRRPPISVRVDTPFVDALAVLVRNRVSGIGLVDHEYHLDGCLSASDLRGMRLHSFGLFNKSVLKWLA